MTVNTEREIQEPTRLDGYTPRSEEIGELYDHLGPLYATLWEGDIHVGIWSGDDDDASMTEAQDRLTDLLIERTPVGPGDRVLDVGCGTGKPALRLARGRGCQVVGITISGSQVAAAGARAAAAGMAERVRFQHADAMSLPFADGSFDGAWAFECLQHMPDFRQVLHEVSRVLRPGSPFVITDCVNQVALTRAEKELFFPALGVSCLTQKELYPEWLRRAGFEVLEMIDLSREIERTIDKMKELLAAKRQELLRHYDDRFLVDMEAAWVTISEIHRNKMGYLLIAARKIA